MTGGTTRFARVLRGGRETGRPRINIEGKGHDRQRAWYATRALCTTRAWYKRMGIDG